MSISPILRIKIKAYLEVFVDNLINAYKGRVVPKVEPSEYLTQKSLKGQLKPFHAAIFSNELLKINEFERGFSSSLGTTYEECAKLIAQEHHSSVHRSYTIKGKVSLAVINEINRQIARLGQASDI